MASNSTRARGGARALAAVAALAFTALAAPAAQAALVAGPITDARGDFLGTYSGPHADDLDLASANVTYDSANIYFTATMFGEIGTTADGLYVWGVDRGGALPLLAMHPNSPDDDQPAVGLHVPFNAFIYFKADGSGQIVNVGGPTFDLAAGQVSHSGNTINLTVSRSALLPTNGSDISQFGFNIWPRITGISDTRFVADFGPDDSNFLGTAVPEPASWALMIGGFGLAGSALRRRRIAAVRA